MFEKIFYKISIASTVLKIYPPMRRDFFFTFHSLQIAKWIIQHKNKNCKVKSIKNALLYNSINNFNLKNNC